MRLSSFVRNITTVTAVVNAISHPEFYIPRVMTLPDPNLAPKIINLNNELPKTYQNQSSNG